MTADAPFFDSHAHLADPAFDADRDEVIARLRASDAVGVVCIGESLAAASRAHDIASRHPGFVFFTAGVHPHDAATFDRTHDIPVIERELDRGAVAVGECGLDYHYDHAPRDHQIAAFEAQLDVARRRGVPVVVHTREAETDTTAMVAAAGRAGVTGILHCYTGSHALARVALDAGWLVSFSGIVTFKKWSDDALIRLIPDDRLLAESDAPYLAPAPFRGKRNEPMWVAHTVASLARARGQSSSNVGQLVTANARRCFGLAIDNTPA